jgi:hypothetical protein
MMFLPRTATVVERMAAGGRCVRTPPIACAVKAAKPTSRRLQRFR